MRRKVTVIILILSFFSVRGQQKPQLVVPLAHTGAIWSINFGYYDRDILTASMDGTAKIWDKYSGKLKATLNNISTGNSPVLSFYGPGNTIVTYPSSSFNKVPEAVIGLWDAGNGNLLQSLKGHKGPINHVAVSPDGTLLVSCGTDTTAVLWDTRTGKPLLVTDSFNFSPQKVIFSNDGKLFAIYAAPHYGWNAQVQLWDAVKKIKIANYKTDGGPIANIDISPDGSRLLIAMLWHKVGYVFDTKTGDLAYELNGHTGNLRYGIFFTPDGKKIISSGGDSTLRIWDAATGKLLNTMRAQRGDIDYVVISPDGKYLASSSTDDKSIIKWEVSTGHFLHKWTVDEPHRRELSFSPKGNYIIYSCGSPTYETTYLFDANNYRLVKKFDNAGGFAVDSSERYICIKKDYHSSVDDYSPWVYNLKSGQLLFTLGKQPEEYKSVSFMQANNRLLYGSGTGVQRLFNLNTGEQEQLFGYRKKGKVYASKVIDNETWVITVKDENVSAWKGSSKRPEYAVKGAEYSVYNIFFSASGSYFAVFDESVYQAFSDTVRIFETRTGRLHSILLNVSFTANTVVFNKDETKLITSGVFEPVAVWDIATQQRDTLLYAGKNFETEDYDNREYEINKNEISSTGKWALTTYNDKNFVHLWDIAGHKPEGVYSIDTVWGDDGVLSFSPGEEYFAISFFNDITAIYKIGNYKPWLVVKGSDLYSFAFGPGNSYAAVASGNDMLVYNLAAKKITATINKGISSLQFIQWDSAHHVSLQTEGNQFLIVNVENGKIVKEYYLEGKVKGIDWMRNKLVVYNNSTVKLHETSSGKEQVTMVMLGGNDVARITPDGYYQAAPGEARNLAWKLNGQIYDFNRWDIQYNRPDKVLQAFGTGNEELENIYRSAYQKRVRKTNADTTRQVINHKLPEVEILNAADIEGITTVKSQAIKIRVFDKENQVQHIDVSVNGSPLFGSAGLKVFTKDTLVNIPVILSEGENKIKISCINNKGEQSLDKTVYATCNSDSLIKPVIWYIGIGVSEYADNKHNLKYAAKDVDDMDSIFSEKLKAKTILLKNENATKNNIIALKQTLIDSTKPEDIVILSLSGHGVVDSNYDFYFAPHDMDFKAPAEKGLSYADLQWLMDSLPARQKLVLVDACHSGELDKESIQGIRMVENDSIKITRSGMELLEDESEQKLGMKNVFSLMQEMFAGTGQSNGATIISAAAGTEFAFEGNNWNNGVFTYCVLKGLTEKLADGDGDGKITVEELQYYVAENVELLTKGRQRPTSRQTNFDNNFVIWE